MSTHTVSTPTHERCVTSYAARTQYKPGEVRPPHRFRQRRREDQTAEDDLRTPQLGLDPGAFPDIPEIQKFDPELAMSLLEGTEFEGGQNWPEITMHMRGQEEHLNSDIMANDIVAQLQENLGMNVSIQVWPEASWRPELFKNEFQLVWIRWWSDYPDPNNGYFDMFYSNKESGKRQAWSNAEFDELTIAGKEAVDPEERLDIYQRTGEPCRRCGRPIRRSPRRTPTTAPGWTPSRR